VNRKDEGVIVVLSGPSGSGKSSLTNEILKNIDNCYVSISTTTRPMRDGEQDGVEYHFVSEEEFLEDIKQNYFLEYATVHGNYYGTSLKPIERALQENKLILFDIDVQGHKAIQERFHDITTSIFITTPTLKELEARLTSRGTDKEEVIKNRLEMAQVEVSHVDEYDFLLINDDFDITVTNLLDIIRVAKLKMSKLKIDNFIAEWV
jgi:guanylate kinase